MNELLIIGMLLCTFLVMFGITTIIENLDAIGEWFFDLGTAYYKWRHHRKKKHGKQ